jgi:hypothetical protein
VPFAAVGPAAAMAVMVVMAGIERRRESAMTYPGCRHASRPTAAIRSTA